MIKRCDECGWQESTGVILTTYSIDGKIKLLCSLCASKYLNGKLIDNTIRKQNEYYS